MRDTHRTGSCGATRLLVAVRHLNVFPKSSLLARNNSKRWGLGAKGGLTIRSPSGVAYRLSWYAERCTCRSGSHMTKTAEVE